MNPSLLSLKGLRRSLSRTGAFRSFGRLLRIPPPPLKQPIFIIGTIRSGKTLLAKCLAKHPRVIYLGRELANEWSDLADIQIARSHARVDHCPPYTNSDATGVRCRSARVGFAELHAARGGTAHKRFLDDNPHLWNKLPFLQEIFPDARLIVTSRDLRSTVASIKAKWIRRNVVGAKRFYIPRDSDYCYTLIPSGSLCGKEPSRVFPGGDVSVLAEYWLRVFEVLEKNLAGFKPPVLVWHRDFISRPHETLGRIFHGVDLPSATYDLPVKLDLSRNEHWQTILSPGEKDQLEAFIASSRHRIERLQYADPTL